MGSPSAFCFCSYINGYIPFYVAQYPIPWQFGNYQMTTSSWFDPLSFTPPIMDLGSRSESYVTVPIRKATALQTITYTDFYIEFKQTSIIPKFDGQMNSDGDGCLTFKAYAITGTGPCFVSSYPPVTSTISIFITQASQSFTLRVLPVNCSGTVNFTLSCGFYSDYLCTPLSVVSGFTAITPDNTKTLLNPFTVGWDGLQWYGWIWRIFIYFLVLIAFVLTLLLAYKIACCLCRRRKSMSYLDQFKKNK
jgi:hypothetical protein